MYDFYGHSNCNIYRSVIDVKYGHVKIRSDRIFISCLKELM